MITRTNDPDFLIVALDFDSGEKAMELVSSLNSVSYYKVGMQLFYRVGVPIVEFLKKSGKKVFLDLKINDIPNTIDKAVSALSALDVDMLTLFCDSDGVKAAQDAVTNKMKIINVTALTSEALNEEEARHRVRARTKMTLESGGNGIVCSGLETGDLRETFGYDFTIVNPGVRPPGSDANDQKRIVTPLQAQKAGATHIVVGRPITLASDPVSVVDSLWNSLTE